jgi:hypothetical protein
VSARDIAIALWGKQLREGSWIAHCPVPGHGRGMGDRSPSLGIQETRNGGVSLKCFAGCDTADIINELRRLRLWSRTSDRGYRCDFTALPHHPGERGAEQAAQKKADEEKRSAWAISKWNATLPASGTLVQTYLNSRGITLIPENIRYHRDVRDPAHGSVKIRAYNLDFPLRSSSSKIRIPR